MNRREYITSCTVAGLVGVAGCLNQEPDDLLWSIEDNGRDNGWTLSDGTIYFSSGDSGEGILQAIDAETGNEEWSFSYEGGRANGRWFVSDGLLFAVLMIPGTGPDRHLIAINTESGHLEWDGVRLVSNAYPIYDNDELFAPPGEQDDFDIQVIDASTGDQTRTIELSDEVWFASREIGVSDDVVYGLTKETDESDYPQLLAKSRSFNSIHWEVDTEDYDWELERPVVGEEAIYFSGNGIVFSLDVDTGEHRWLFEGIERPSAPVLSNRSLYVSTSNSIFAFDADTGTKHWHTEFSASPSQPVVDSNYIYIVDGGGDATVLDKNTGDVVWQTNINSNRSPIGGDDDRFRSTSSVQRARTWDGKLFAISQNGTLYAFDPEMET